MDNAFVFGNYSRTLLMKHTKRSLSLTLAIILGLGGAAVIAQTGDAVVTLCFRNRTIKVPSYLSARYLARPGTTAGPCVTTP